MTPVILESPFAADTAEDRAAFARYRDACILDCLRNGEAPFASHLMYTDILDDTKPEERKLSVKAGFVWRPFAKLTVVYTDLGISPGMKLGIADARRYCDEESPLAHDVVYRELTIGELRKVMHP